ncbi:MULTISPECIES: sensor histidine kinase [Paenarthrobacter]|uniref:histidine kinase n=1 Tax=Paenarthrobacter ureafaciens TaxID=37931 RepID=A0AAX3EFV1_PAEUR|nr:MULTISPECIES: sensor histidine kinase [Paenarthrobacter]MDO5865184.1 sensor histidine kinase [Paenarthrobacter sp. SD-2]MDO5876261.1 sensor histidine kinase [Paenarthrobacter sp. SD-1]UYV91532.1 sensor histidine kinase [Paenarthrobacter ureafaciens]UYV96052.1 sensor histidine kinase [Paenarthrobacter ureafaciens]WIV31426.1 sensor histidine kinase [Paenarthrobacter sp. R1]
MSHSPKPTVAPRPAPGYAPWRTVLMAPTRSDILTTAAAIGFDLVGMWLNWAGSFMPQEPLAVGLYFLIGLPLLAWRHMAPLMVFAFVWVHQLLAVPIFAPEIFAAGIQATDVSVPAPMSGVLVAIAALASDKPLRISIPAAIAVLIPFVIAYARDGLVGWEPGGIFTMMVILASAWFIGWLLGRNRRRIRYLQQLQEDAAEAVFEERAQIAAELHDIVSHAVTVMTLHAAGASRIIDQDPRRAEEALEVIERVGSQTMDELRRLLELMRANGSGVEGLHSLHDLESLVSPVRSAGIDVQVSSSGDPRPLDPSVGHAAFRVVQEALTNVTKHVGTNTKATVRLHWTKDRLHVEVLDYGGESPKANKASGYGLLGLHERVALVGGRLSYGPEGHGFAVRAELPTAAQASAHLGTNID